MSERMESDIHSIVPKTQLNTHMPSSCSPPPLSLAHTLTHNAKSFRGHFVAMLSQGNKKPKASDSDFRMKCDSTHFYKYTDAHRHARTYAHKHTHTHTVLYILSYICIRSNQTFFFSYFCCKLA